MKSKFKHEHRMIGNLLTSKKRIIKQDPNLDYYPPKSTKSTISGQGSVLTQKPPIAHA